MKLYINDHRFHYEMENLCRVFFPHDEIVRLDGRAHEEDEEYIETSKTDNDTGHVVAVRVRLGGRTVASSGLVNGGGDECELKMATLLFRLLSDLTGYSPKWGVLTGVRPAKLMGRLIESGGRDGARRYFTDRLLVSPEKTELAMRVSDNQRRAVGTGTPKDYSLYISIPFCPTRCSYCSFVSSTVDRAAKLLPDYLVKLGRELSQTAETANELGLKLRTVYIGGGTPTVLTAEQLRELTDTVADRLDLDNADEYTVEAGRPDTVTREKLEVLKSSGVTRISVNPQTLNDEVLAEIGRKHTAQQAIDAFLLARECGFDNINMDLIAGLPKDTFESFNRTLDQVVELAPESITVHTLALKRSSSLVMRDGYTYTTTENLTADQLGLTNEYAERYGYIPYYMYRQSRTVGNLENVGYSKVGKECLYNIFMMEELHTVLACGAGAVTKLRDPDSIRIERVFNFKYPYEYISRFDELISRKSAIADFYNSLTV